jgi:hypothetical protein
VDEVMEIFCDKAEAILREALESEHEGRRDVASRFVLTAEARTAAGRDHRSPLQPSSSRRVRLRSNGWTGPSLGWKLAGAATQL